MPELPEVETVRRGLNRVTLNQLIWGGDVLLPRTIAHPISVGDFLPGIVGCEICTWQRRGKYLLAELVKPHRNSPKAAGWLGVHLRMTGQLLWVKQDEPLAKHCRIRLFFPHQRELRFVDQRTFGQMWWVPPDRPPETIITGLQRLGPEPFSDAFSIDYLATQLARSQRPIKNALLDQSLVAGVGNIYADEALFLSQIHPQTPSAALSREQIARLHPAIVQVLQDSIGAGGTTFSDFRDVQGINGNYGGQAWVYDRAKQPCRRCETPIERIKLAGRSSHFCPHCQPKIK
ncbi:DNA-formamidopyrimidine glycosylase [Microcoleus sp. FACHB-1515]|uniref:DNA-formamidopyrimidine glycosylase n=1 Tax=Cyanophyceae TaxID=3028117 RepID=UPI001682DAF5|nr:DNA-formamidopyrimidine glycosylase [Microcoleus sp. FACHB-1515]MBD2089910.1 DNA-formamidopyrimidine glycosylase [Microcoleus sp. FACHB-1515]